MTLDRHPSIEKTEPVPARHTGERRSAAGESTADDDALDLGRALEDRVDLRVPVPLLHREVLDVAVPTEDLHRLLGDPDGGLARLELRHRALGVLELSVAREPRR